MTPERQRFVIATVCEHTDLGIRLIGDPMSICFNDLCSGIVGHGGYTVPDYLNSLDAMHLAEKKLNRGQRAKFRQYLGDMFPRDEDGDTTGWEGRFGRAIHSTPAQRGEAFLKALDLWEN